MHVFVVGILFFGPIVSARLKNFSDYLNGERTSQYLTNHENHALFLDIDAYIAT
jgi:hypothetical protein